MLRRYFNNKWWPIITYGLLTIILFVINYRPGTYLTGWDNLHPEFNFGLNIGRSLFSVWQEASTGLSFGHTPDFVHQIALLILSFIFPSSVLRYLWTFLMLFIGSCGAYKLAQYFFFRSSSHTQIPTTHSTPHQESRIKNQESWKENENPLSSIVFPLSFFPFLAGLFYMLNLATMQTFYAPFEAFTGHFAALPWLLLASLTYWHTPTRRNLTFISIVLLLATPGVYIPTLFITYIFALSLLIGVSLLQNLSIKAIYTTLKLYAIIVVINAFWLFPFIYFTITNASINVNSKINQMATDTIYFQNKEFGDPFSVARLVGFWFHNVDPNREGNFTYMMGSWITWAQNPILVIIELLLFGIVIVGLYAAIRQKYKLVIPFIALFIAAFGVLAISTFPFSLVNDIIRTIFPILNQAFRFPFTKFSILTALTYALFFAYGVEYIHHKFAHGKLKTISFAAIILLLLPMLPTFTGNFFYDKARLTIPQEYFSLFDYFSHQDINTRIANLPQQTFWGWNFYKWGYGGSGFLWYGIKQPILDRAYDVWSNTSENYYFELQQALYAKDTKAIDKILQKYQVGFLVFDQNIINPFAPKALFYPQTNEVLSKLSDVHKVETFGNILVYKVDLKSQSKDYISVAKDLPTANQYVWNAHDTVFQNQGNYIANNDKTSNIIYPFRSLFSLKNADQQYYSYTEANNTISLTTHFPKPTTNMFSLPDYMQAEKTVPVTLLGNTDTNGEYIISLKIENPSISINGTEIKTSNSSPIELFIIPKESLTRFPFVININGVTNFTIKNADQRIATTSLPLNQDSTLSLTDDTHQNTVNQTIPRSMFLSLSTLHEQKISIDGLADSNTLTFTYPKINDSYLAASPSIDSFDKVKNCDFFRRGNTAFQDNTIQQSGFAFDSVNTTACISYYQASLPHDQGYITVIKATNERGHGVNYWVLNEDTKYSPLSTILPSNKKTAQFTFILPPQETFGRAYSFHFDNTSIGPDEVKNSLSRFSVYPIPYSYLSEISFTNAPTSHILATPLVSHQNQSIYTVSKMPQGNNQTVMLSQSYNRGWTMYRIPKTSNILQNAVFEAFPMVFGKKEPAHVLINNWSNGWTISTPLLNNQQFVIVYLPQYLEYGGFILLFICADFLLDPLYPFEKMLKQRITSRKRKHLEEN